MSGRNILNGCMYLDILCIVCVGFQFKQRAGLVVQGILLIAVNCLFSAKRVLDGPQYYGACFYGNYRE